MRQKLTFAAALLHEPQALVIDEPMVGLDPKGARLLKDLFRGFVDRGGTILMSTHTLEVAEAMCDRIAIINHGKLIANEPTRELVGKAQEKVVAVTVDRDVATLPANACFGKIVLKGTRTLEIPYAKDRVNAGEVLAAVRAAWPSGRPLSVRISATDWADGGQSEADLLTVARALKHAGVDLIDVSTGQTVPWQKPVYGRMWQTPFADEVRNEIGIAAIAVGNIYEPDHVNTIIAAGRADLCAIARPHLANPAWTLQAAAGLGYEAQWWPKQYLAGKAQLERNLQRAAAITGVSG